MAPNIQMVSVVVGDLMVSVVVGDLIFWMLNDEFSDALSHITTE